MKFFIALSLFAFSVYAQNTEKLLFEVKYRRGSHEYRMYQIVSKTKVYRLEFKNEKNEIIKRLLSESQADELRNDATRILWTNGGKKKLEAESCKVYAQIKVGVENSSVCSESASMVGDTMGFLNQLHKIVTK